MLDVVREMPCAEDFEPWDTNVRKDFLRKLYHTRSKKVKTVSLEECMEDEDSGIHAVADPAAAFMERKVGRGNIFSAVVHMDEKTPHLHLCFTPITKDGRLSAKEILGSRAQLSKWQDEFHAHMSKAFPALQRGESTLVTKWKHIPTWLFKQAVNLSKQVRAIEATLDYISTLNVGKKKEEAFVMLKK